MKTILEPTCLKWARERAALTTFDIADKLGVKEETVLAWEANGEITLSQSERLAHLTHTPVGYLFLPEPPVEKLPIADFRTVGTTGVRHVTPDLIDVINDAILRQEWYRGYLIHGGEAALGFVGCLAVTASIADSARKIRVATGWDTKVVGQSASGENALAKQIDAVEQSGVTVMRSGVVGNNTYRVLSVDDFRGFALSDSYAPLIFINGSDAKSAQMFTLAHELVHIWLGVSGVSSLDRSYSHDHEAELFCNAVAAELLVPSDELKEKWAEVRVYSDYVARLERHFRVSSLVVLRRLRDASHLTQHEFREEYDKAWSNSRHRIASGSSGGDFYNTLRSRTGKRLLSALVGSTLEGRTRYRDAIRLLGLKSGDTLRKVAARLIETA